MQAEKRTENTVLKPAHDELAEIWRVHLAAEETADVRRPPRNAAEADVQPGANLLAQIFPRRVNVARPNGRAVSLAAGKTRAAERNNFLFARRSHAFVQGLLLHHRVNAAHFEAVAGVVTHVVVVVRDHFRLDGVEPPDFDAVAIII